jgi:uncharacterized membrane protein
MEGLIRSSLATLVFLGLILPFPVQRAMAQDQAVVRAVLFFSPTCPHCHQVINEDLPVIFDNHGGPPRVWYDQSVPQADRAIYYITNGQLEVLLVDVSKPAGGPLYAQSTTRFEVPQPRSGVPRLVVGDSVMVGSIEIPQIFPQLIQQAMADGGLDWPEIEGLESVIPAIPDAPVVVTQTDSTAPPEREAPSDTAPPVEPVTDAQPTQPSEAADTSGAVPDHPRPAPDTVLHAPPDQDAPDSVAAATPATLGDIPVSQGSMLDAFRRDPVGNGASVFVLVIMIVSLLVVGRYAPEWADRRVLVVAVPVLAVIGIVVAGYLTYVETSGAAAVCGPVGDCNAVQQSPYARLFGVIPVGLLGLLSYCFVLCAWLVARRSDGPTADWARLALLGIAFVGTVFSIYLTFLEPFVIGATCLWCLSSSLIITALLWLTAGSGTAAWARITSASQPPASETP